MRRVSGIAAVLLLAGAVCSGCSAGVLGTEDPDLVVYNDSTAILGSILVSGEEESGGDNRCYIQELDERWYYYEMEF